METPLIKEKTRTVRTNRDLERFFFVKFLTQTWFSSSKIFSVENIKRKKKEKRIIELIPRQSCFQRWGPITLELIPT